MSYNCNQAIGNTGVDCFALMKKAAKLYFVPYYNSTGAINQLTLTPGAYTDTAFKALINQSDKSKRWYPSPPMVNAIFRREASITKTNDDNNIVVIQKGVKKFTAEIQGEAGASPIMLYALLTQRKQKFGVYVVDIDGNFHFNGKYAGFATPIQIDVNSIDPIFNTGEDKDITKITVNFNTAPTENDTDLTYLDAQVDIDPAASLLTYQGLLDVTPTFTSLVHTLVKLSLQTKYGSGGTTTSVHGLLASAFTGVKVTGTGTYGTPSTATEEVDSNGNGTGIYDLVFSAPASGDTIKVQVIQNGFDLSVVNNTISAALT